MLDGEVILVPHLLRFLRAAYVLVVNVGGKRVGLHLGPGPERRKGRSPFSPFRYTSGSNTNIIVVGPPYHSA